jgi:predicted house-cleaning noncanonical NTP pyrophosphatase (MazG superfamily)
MKMNKIQADLLKGGNIGKMIRDNYDTIIETDRLRIVDNPSERFIYHTQKVKEELSELADTAYNDVEEFADVIEALYALAEFQGVSKDQIEIARLKKLDEKGGFKKCLVLKG